MQRFESLNSEEIHLLMDAPALVAILIGGSDGNFDREERFWAEKMLKARTFGEPKPLEEYNLHVAEQFWARMTALLVELPQDLESRNTAIEERLKQLNPILAKLSPETGGSLYGGLLRLAKETASTSGGFLRFGAISTAEAKWLELPMITPIAIPKSAPVADDEAEMEEDN